MDQTGTEFNGSFAEQKAIKLRPCGLYFDEIWVKLFYINADRGDDIMIKLNDYLYSGDTIFRILDKYIADLRKEAKRTHNAIDLIHCNFLLQDVYKRQHKYHHVRLLHK